MADAVSTIYLAKGPRYAIVRLTNISDGTGESAVKKVDLTALELDNGVAPTKCSVKKISWTIQGFTYVELTWDHTTPNLIDLLTGNWYREYSELGMLSDPGGAGGTGSVMLTTVGGAAASTYDILLSLTLS